MRRAGAIAAAMSAAALTVAVSTAAGARVGSPELISATPDGLPGNGPSLFPSVSEDGRIVAFRSEATDIVADDGDSVRDVYVRDRRTGFVTLVSRASGASGAKGDRHSYNPRISANGRYVAFRSNATNLVPEDADPGADVYVRDLDSNQTVLVSRASTPVGAKGNADSNNASISANGRFVAFRSEATNLHPDDTDPLPDVYVRDLQTAELALVSRASGATGAKGIGVSAFPVISGDGTRIAFRSTSPNLAPEDPDSIEDIFLRDLESSETILISRAAGDGPKGDARSTFVSLSADGSEVAFDSQSSNLHPDDTTPDADVFLRRVATGEVELISRAQGEAGAKGVPGSSEPALSADGRHVAFQSAASNLDPDDTDGTLDVYVRDRERFSTEALSPALEAPHNRSFEAQIAADGKLVGYQADAGTAGSGPSVPPSDVFASGVPKPDRCLGKRVTTYAAADVETRGTRGNDVILATDGDETIKGGRGKDRICAAGGDDVVKGGKGNDKIEGRRGRDKLVGGGGRDRLKAGGGRDRLKGGGGPDRLDGGSGKDRCDGGSGSDELKRCEIDLEEKGKKEQRVTS